MSGFYVEVDDDARRAGGTGGYYVLYWRDGEGHDEWYQDADAFPGVLEDQDIDWLSEAESDQVPGAHPHGSAYA